MKHQITYSQLARVRWNVLDMITYVGRKAVRGFLREDIDMTWVESLRALLKQRGQRTTVTAILLKAIAIAQRNHPISRTGYLPFSGRVVFEEIAAGFTVEKVINGEPTVFFGTIDAPDSKDLETITSELGAYAERPIMDVPRLAKEAKFNYLPWLLRRFILWLGMNIPAVRLCCNQATFGLTTLGKFGIAQAIPPCACASTFGVGTVEVRPEVRDGVIVTRPMMSLTLIVDVRIMDMDPAARFLCEIRDLLEGGLAKYIDEPGFDADGALLEQPAQTPVAVPV